MANKTPEEMAEEWILDNRVDMLPHPCKSAFLAGYKAAQPQWISVKDRLPEESVGWTMVYGCILSRWWIQPGFYDTERKEWISRFINEYEDEEGYCPFESVTHWMPLPDAPKEENVITSLDQMVWPQKRITVEEAREMFPDKLPEEES